MSLRDNKVDTANSQNDFQGDSIATSKEESLISHLVELRQRLIYVLIVIFVLFVLLFPFRSEFYTHFAMPAIRSLTKEDFFIIPKAADAFFIPVKLCLFASFIISLPWLLYQIWAFIAPGLYKHEKKFILPIVVSSTVLFYVGMLFAYFVVVPLAFSFFVSSVPIGVKLTPDISNYLSFVLTLFIAFGVAFEVPIFTIILVLSGVSSVDSLRKKRRYVIVAVFVIGMLLTPADPYSQTLLAVPMWLLFESGLFFAARMVKNKEIARQKDLAKFD